MTLWGHHKGRRYLWYYVYTQVMLKHVKAQMLQHCKYVQKARLEQKHKYVASSTLVVFFWKFVHKWARYVLSSQTSNIDLRKNRGYDSVIHAYAIGLQHEHYPKHQAKWDSTHNHKHQLQCRKMGITSQQGHCWVDWALLDTSWWRFCFAFANWNFRCR